MKKKKKRKCPNANNASGQIKYELVIKGDVTKADCDNIFCEHEKILKKLIARLSDKRNILK